VVVEGDLPHGERLAEQQAHLLLPLVGRQKSEAALLPLAQRAPALDPRGLERVQQVLALEGEIALKDHHRHGVREQRNLADR